MMASLIVTTENVSDFFSELNTPTKVIHLTNDVLRTLILIVREELLDDQVFYDEVARMILVMASGNINYPEDLDWFHQWYIYTSNQHYRRTDKRELRVLKLILSEMTSHLANYVDEFNYLMVNTETNSEQLQNKLPIVLKAVHLPQDNGDLILEYYCYGKVNDGNNN